MASVSRKVRKLATALIMVLAMVAGMLGGVATAHADSQVTSVPTENSTGEGDPSTPPVNKPETTTTEGSTTSDNQTTTPQPGKTEQAPTNPDQSSTSKDSSSPSVRSIELRTVTFDTNGAFTPTPPAQTIQNNMFPARPSTDPMRTGYHFDGWFNGDTNYDFATPVTADLTLTAHWTKASGEWGLNPSYGPVAGGTKVTLIPPQVSDSSQISAARFHSMVLTSNGTIYTWGHNDGGALGDGTTRDRSKPVKVSQPKPVQPDFRFTQISMGYEHSVALGSDGKAYAWGNNGNGELGIGNSWGHKTTPVEVLPPAGAPAGFRYTQIGAGYGYTAALGSDGNVYAWGSGEHGHLGTDNHGSRSRAGQVKRPAGTNPDFRFTRITVAEHSVFALGSDGNAYAWGENADGQLGDRSKTKRWTPVMVKKPSSSPGFTYTQISCIYGSTLALGSDGNAYGWGANESGQLGNGNKNESKLPVQVRTPSTAPKGFRYVQISAGHSHGLAIGSDGKAYAWGRNQYKQLGDDSRGPRTIPAELDKPSGVASDFRYTQVCAGISDSVAIGSDGSVYYWGRINMSGSQYLSHPVKVSVPDVSSGSTGIIKVNAVKFDGTNSLTAPADNGDGTWLVTSPRHAAGVVDVSVDWTLNGYPSTSHLSYQYEDTYYTVTIDTADGRPVTTQQIRAGDYVDRPSPDPTRPGWLFDGWFVGSTNIAYNFSKPVFGDLTLTAHWSRENRIAKEDGKRQKHQGRISRNTAGGLIQPRSTGSLGWRMNPIQGPESGGNTVNLIPPMPRGFSFSQISIGDHHVAAVGSDHNVYTWGDNTYGQLGNGTTNYSAKPTKANFPNGVDAAHFSYISVSAGAKHTIALGSDNKVYAWGDNSAGQLGDGTLNSSSEPVVVHFPVDNVIIRQISAGSTHSMALQDGGQTVWGWGDSKYGRLGIGDPPAEFIKEPVKAQLSPAPYDSIVGISAGSWHSTARSFYGDAWAWGYNYYGQLGLGTTNSYQWVPAAIPKPSGDNITYLGISAGGSHTLLVGSDGNVYGTGYNSSGQLGDGSTDNKRLPTLMNKPDPNVRFIDASAGGYHSLIQDDEGHLYGCGANEAGQLGNGTFVQTNKLLKVLAPPKVESGFTYSGAFAAGADYQTASVAVGSNGMIYSFGSNKDNKLGNELVPADKPTATPVRSLFPERGAPESVLFDNVPGKNVTRHGSDETWDVTVPEHNHGDVKVTVVWNISGSPQDDAVLTYTYLHTGILPNAGGSGILLVLLSGFLIMSGALAVRHHHMNKKINPDTMGR